MNLYGVAIAILPTKDDARIYRVSFTPIVMDSRQAESFQVLDDMAYKEEVNALDVEASMKSFARGVETLRRVTELQHESFREAGERYRPVCVTMGDASASRIKLRESYMLLFGRNFTLLNRHWPIRLASTRKEMDNAASLHKDYLKDHDAYPQEFIEACATLKKIAHKCTLHKASYNTASSGDLVQTGRDKRLLELKALYPHDAEAQEEITTLAYNQGRSTARHVKNHTFGLYNPAAHLPEAERSIYASYEYLGWEPEFEAAFRKGFAETYKGPPMRLKLAHEKANPPYSDPTFNDLLTLAAMIHENSRYKPHDSRDIRCELATAATRTLHQHQWNATVRHWGERLSKLHPRRQEHQPDDERGGR